MVEEKSYEVAWGARRGSLTIPRENMAAELKMTDLPRLPDVSQAIVDSMEHPIGSTPLSEQLKPGQKVALVTGDRITDVMLGVRDGVGTKILDHLNRLGIRDDDVTLVHAGGSHANLDWASRLGKDLFDRVKVVRHDAHDDSQLKYLGVSSFGTPVWVNRVVAEADFSLAVGEICPTVHGGWTGGGKIILPGVAGMDTIEQNHFALVRDVNTAGLADGNHMRRDMEEAARMANLGMKVDIVVNSRAEPVGVTAGDFYKEHRTGLNKARQIWMTKMDPVDVYVVYPGDGWEQYLSGCMWIRLEGAEIGIKPGGIVILAASAAGGWASKERLEQDQVAPSSVMKMSTEEMARTMLRRKGNIRNISMLYSAKRVLERQRVFLVCDGISVQEASEFGFAHCSPRFEEAISLALAERGKDATIAVNIQSKIGWRTMPWREG